MNAWYKFDNLTGVGGVKDWENMFLRSWIRGKEFSLKIQNMISLYLINPPSEFNQFNHNLHVQSVEEKHDDFRGMETETDNPWIENKGRGNNWEYQGM